MKKAILNQKIYEVVDSEEYYRNPSIGNFNEFTAIQDNGLLYPIRNASKICGPGYYTDTNSCISRYVEPELDEYDKYSVEQNLIDFNSNNIKEIIDKSERLKSMETEILISKDNIFNPVIKDDDEPEMQLLKTAINKKNIDIDKYESRFESNFQNEKRLFNKPTITFGKLKRIGKATDMKITLRIEDASPEVPNPIGEVLEVVITD